MGWWPGIDLHLVEYSVSDFWSFLLSTFASRLILKEDLVLQSEWKEHRTLVHKWNATLYTKYEKTTHTESFLLHAIFLVYLIEKLHEHLLLQVYGYLCRLESSSCG